MKILGIGSVIEVAGEKFSIVGITKTSVVTSKGYVELGEVVEWLNDGILKVISV